VHPEGHEKAPSKKVLAKLGLDKPDATTTVAPGGDPVSAETSVPLKAKASTSSGNNSSGDKVEPPDVWGNLVGRK
ncbi:MAG: hypothetical protein ACRDQ2_12165, partial [Gaiellales bacterium]